MTFVRFQNLRKRSQQWTHSIFDLVYVLLAVSLVSCLVLNTCVDRPRDNPLDPKNPKTLGKPTGLRLICAGKEVTLSWDKLDVTDTRGFIIYRKKQNENKFTRLKDMPVTGTNFVDSDVQYGQEYTYRITLETEGWESPPSEEKSIIPGPSYTWVVDSFTGEIVRLCHDLRYTLFRVGYIAFPTALAVSTSESAAWVLDQFGSRIYKISEQGEFEFVLNEIDNPTSVAVNQHSGEVWIAQRYHKTVYRLDRLGNIRKVYANFQEPVSIAVHSGTRDCYVADRTARQVVQIRPFMDRQSQLQKEFISPQYVAVDESHSSIWIADSTRVLKYDFAPEVSGWTEISGFYWAQLLAPDSDTGECWVVDLERSNTPAKLLKIDPHGQLLFEISEFGHPTGMSVNRFDGSCMVADFGYRRLAKISIDGQNIDFVSNIDGPQDVAVEYHD